MQTALKQPSVIGKIAEPISVLAGVGAGLGALKIAMSDELLSKVAAGFTPANVAAASGALFLCACAYAVQAYRAKLKANPEVPIGTIIDDGFPQPEPEPEISKNFNLDLAKLGPVWMNAWRWKEVSRKDAFGNIEIWQFTMIKGRLYLDHYHRARPLKEGETCPEGRLWNGYEVICCYNQGCNDPEIRTEQPPMPQDVLLEAERKHLDRMAQISRGRLQGNRLQGTL
ncbi:hypothetical protein SAMN06265795_105117 [Noviherbaspirillum humi]|uniref:Uncharacterized protein n=2 Tax=Noviherbaspirillum humi TaxID=1688639 RepID=A0A239GPA6_9BURK|nr:hypothetical protein SAMN06265795_105117 [Noviherbaspirillum humi]